MYFAKRQAAQLKKEEAQNMAMAAKLQQLRKARIRAQGKAKLLNLKASEIRKIRAAKTAIRAERLRKFNALKSNVRRIRANTRTFRKKARKTSRYFGF